VATVYDRRLTDPRLDQLALVLVAAVSRVNNRRASPLDGSADVWRRAAELTGPEGWQWWVLGVGSRVDCAWWTDPFGRRHCRIVGQVLRHGEPSAPIAAEGDRPPAWRVFPEYFVLRQTAGSWKPLAACACGAVGTPEALAWAGNCCGPCHDRRLEGWPVPRGRTLLTVSAGGLFMTRDGLRIAIDTGAELRLWDRAADQTTVERRNPLGVLQAARFLAGGPPPSGNRPRAPRARTAVNLQITDRGVMSVQRGPALSLVRRLGEDGQWHDVATIDGQIWSAVLLPTGMGMVAVRSGSVDLIDLPGSGYRTVASCEPFSVRSAVAPDGRAIALLSSQDRGRAFRYRLQLIDLSGGQSLPVPPGADESVTAVAFPPRPAGTLLTGHADGSLRLWDVAAGVERSRLAWHAGAVRELAFSADGELLATGGGDGSVRLWPWRRLVEA